MISRAVYICVEDFFSHVGTYSCALGGFEWVRQRADEINCERHYRVGVVGLIVIAVRSRLVLVTLDLRNLNNVTKARALMSC